MRGARMQVMIALWLFLPSAVAFALVDWKDWPRSREIVIPDASAAAAHVLVTLDGAVFASSQRNLQDLRIADDQGGEIPSKLVIPHEATRTEARPAGILDRTRESSGDFRLTLDLGPDPQRHNRVSIETPDRSFSRQVRIETGDDNRQWGIARGDGYVFDFTRDAKARYLEISYPVSAKRYVRVTILNGNQPPIRIDGAAVQFSIEQEEKRTDWPVAVQSNVVDQKLRATVMQLDLGYEKVPTSRIELRTSADNFHRHVEIEGGNRAGEERPVWTAVGSGEIFSVALGETRRRQLWIDYPETRFRFLRVRIFHYDDRPLEIQGAAISGRPRQLLFWREPGRSYRLLYGNPEAPAPRYDLEQLSSYLDLTQLRVLSLGEEHRQAPPPPAAKPWFDRQPFLLWGTLLAAALLLGWLILRLARNVAD